MAAVTAAMWVTESVAMAVAGAGTVAGVVSTAAVAAAAVALIAVVASVTAAVTVVGNAGGTGGGGGGDDNGGSGGGSDGSYSELHLNDCVTSRDLSRTLTAVCDTHKLRHDVLDTTVHPSGAVASALHCWYSTILFRGSNKCRPSRNANECGGPRFAVAGRRVDVHVKILHVAAVSRRVQKIASAVCRTCCSFCFSVIRMTWDIYARGSIDRLTRSTSGTASRARQAPGACHLRHACYCASFSTVIYTL